MSSVDIVHASYNGGGFWEAVDINGHARTSVHHMSTKVLFIVFLVSLYVSGFFFFTK